MRSPRITARCAGPGASTSSSTRPATRISARSIALEAMKNGKHIVMLNVEADITIGRFLKEEARKAGVVYTGAAGDEPAATRRARRLRPGARLRDRRRRQGQEQPAAVRRHARRLRGRGAPAQHERAHAGRIRRRLEDDDRDGRGRQRHRPRSRMFRACTGRRRRATSWRRCFAPRQDGGILESSGVVDYSIGKGVAPGVFCIVKPRHPRVLERMIDLKVGPGPVLRASCGPTI